LVSGLTFPGAIAVSGDKLFVVNPFANTVGEYTTSGATVNASLISGLNNPAAIAVASDSVPEPSSSWTLLLGLTVLFGIKSLLRRPV
jgi:PEP-CTERM motif